MREEHKRVCLTCGKPVSDMPLNLSDPNAGQFCWGGSGKEQWVEIAQTKPEE